MFEPERVAFRTRQSLIFPRNDGVNPRTVRGGYRREGDQRSIQRFLRTLRSPFSADREPTQHFLNPVQKVAIFSEAGLGVKSSAISLDGR
jgi:hypothetical protein